MKVAVIGAGASGLAAIKTCLDEGLDVVGFERTNYISGLWHYTEDVEDGQACVMKSTVINTTKETMCYSDFPIPKEEAIFMHNRAVDKYFHLYADEFGLKKKIRFNTEVVSVKQADTFKDNGQWEIVTRGHSDSNTTRYVFDAVMVCTGHHAFPNVPSFPGMKQFKGKIMHSHDYKHGAGFEDKRVVVVGIGNSGGDIAVELSKIASQVFISTRSGAWIFYRIDDGGDPVGMTISRAKIAFAQMFPNIAANANIKKFNKRMDHDKYNLKPNFPPLCQHPTVNDDLPNRIATGTVKIKRNVSKFTSNGVEFEDGTEENDIDCVIMATGYIFGFPFIDKSVVDVVDNEVKLYKYMFPPELEHNTLAIIGCYQPLGAIMPMSEQQCRLATRVFKGQAVLPNKTVMWADINDKRDAMAKRYSKSLRHTIQVDYVPYMDELSELSGNRPKLLRLFFSDPVLAWECYFGPPSPYQYRLMGPGAWDGAREAIMTQWDRAYYPLNKNYVDIVAARKRAAKKRRVVYLLGLGVLSVGGVIGYMTLKKDVDFIALLKEFNFKDLILGQD